MSPRPILTLVILLLATGLRAEEIRVAVAANFRPCLDVLVEEFEASTSHEVVVASGSTGRHYAQITAGAPFDIFLAADSRRPRELEASGHAVSGSRFCYARGVLILWWPTPPTPAPTNLQDALTSPHLKHLALANPRLAPYGEAAREALQDRSVPSPEDLRLFFVGKDYKRKGGELAVAATQALRNRGLNAELTMLGCSPPRSYKGVTAIEYLDKSFKDFDEIERILGVHVVGTLPNVSGGLPFGRMPGQRKQRWLLVSSFAVLSLVLGSMVMYERLLRKQRVAVPQARVEAILKEEIPVETPGEDSAPLSLEELQKWLGENIPPQKESQGAPTPSADKENGSCQVKLSWR